MLSFMREQEFEDSPGRKPVAADNAKEPKEQEYLTVEAKGKNVRKTTYVLAVLFGIGLLCLLFMIKRSAPQTATAAAANTTETQIEKAIARLTGIKSEMFNRMDEIVKKFYEFSDVQQVELSELVKNPFERDGFWGNPRKIADTEKEKPDTDLMRQQRLQLLCIMQSAQGNCCMIDDKILYEGDSIEGFKVRQIGDSFVRLECDRNGSESVEAHHQRTQIVLKLSDGNR
jgi:preprotein translocase subunit SecG